MPLEGMGLLNEKGNSGHFEGDDGVFGKVGDLFRIKTGKWKDDVSVFTLANDSFLRASSSILCFFLPSSSAETSELSHFLLSRVGLRLGGHSLSSCMAVLQKGSSSHERKERLHAF